MKQDWYEWYVGLAEDRKKNCYYDKNVQLINKDYLKGLEFAGYYDDSKKFNLKDIESDFLMLSSAIDVACIEMKYRKHFKIKISSYRLKHIVEDYLCSRTNGKIRYVSNGVMIFAMLYAGFIPERIEGTPNCYFSVSRYSINYIFRCTH